MPFDYADYVETVKIAEIANGVSEDLPTELAAEAQEIVGRLRTLAGKIRTALDADKATKLTPAQVDEVERLKARVNAYQAGITERTRARFSPQSCAKEVAARTPRNPGAGVAKGGARG